MRDREHHELPDAQFFRRARRRAGTRDIERRGAVMDALRKTSGPITAILFDYEHGIMWGAASHHGEDCGIAW